MPNFPRNSRSFFAARNGSSAKPLKILVYCAGWPMPAARYWFFIASATTTKWVVARGGIFFSGAENEVGGGVLEIAERRAMNRVDDDRNARAPCREPAKNARLAAVGVDDVGLLFAQDFFQSAERQKILERMNGADEFGNDCRAVREFLQTSGSSEPSGPMVGPEKFTVLHFDGRASVAQAEDGGDGVFLRAADDEPGDDVSDAHRASGWLTFEFAQPFE